MVKKRKNGFCSKQLESHCKIFNIKMDAVENVITNTSIIDEIEESYSKGARILMAYSEGMLKIETTHDFLKRSYLVDVTSGAREIIKEMREGSLSYKTRLQLQDSEVTEFEFPIVIFEVERSVEFMLEDVQVLQKWMEHGRKIWRTSVRNSKGILLAVAYVSDQKYFDWTKLWLKKFISRKKTYQHNLKIQHLYEEELVNTKVAKLFEADLQCSGFIPVKSAQVEYRRIQRVLRTTNWINRKVKK